MNLYRSLALTCLLSSPCFSSSSISTSKQISLLAQQALLAYRHTFKAAKAPDGSTKVITQADKAYLKDKFLFIPINDVHKPHGYQWYKYSLITHEISHI